MTIGSKVRITRGRYKGQLGTVAGLDRFTNRLIIRTTANLPVWVSPASVKAVA